MADTGDFSRSVTKIDRMQHLAAMPLDDAEASWEEYAAVRKIIIIYLQVVGLDQPQNFGPYRCGQEASSVWSTSFE